MTAGERFKNWIDGLSEAWKDRLRGWMASWVEGGVIRLFDFLEPDLRSEIKPSLLRIREAEGLPDDFKALIDKTLEEPKAIHLAAILPYLVGMMIGLGMGAARPVSNVGSYQIDRLLKSFRLDPAAVITAWRRDKVKYEQYFDDLKDQGWSDDRIEAFKFLTLFIPTADEQTLWLAREVYEPEMVTRYGLDSELPSYEQTDFGKVGVTPEQMTNKWRAHWEHASFMQVVEMLHRGLLSLDPTMPTPPTTEGGWAARDAEGEEALFDWYRLVEIPPFWRDRLTAMSWNVPTRVDVRRWYDMRTIDEAELYNVYHRQGYHGKDLDNYVLWTKVYVAFPDLMARWTNGWITENDVYRELTGLGMPDARVREMIETKKKAVEGAQAEEGKALNKSEIYKGVKAGHISRDQGIDLLMDLNYNLATAEYLLEINVAALEGSPETYEEFKDITTRYKLAVGKEAKPMPEELKKAAEELARVTKEVEALERSIVEEERGLIPGEFLPEAATARLQELRIILHRAESELARVKTDYLGKLAQWRHGG